MTRRDKTDGHCGPSRGVDNGRMRRTFEPMRELLERVVRGLDLERELRNHSVETVWARVAGPRLAPHTRAGPLRGGRLTVEARSAAWMHDVALRREELRARLNTELGGPVVEEIRVRLGGAFPSLGGEPAREPALTDRELEAAAHELAEAGGGDEGARLAARARALQKRRVAARR
jgi:hypothetical protein